MVKIKKAPPEGLVTYSSLCFRLSPIALSAFLSSHNSDFILSKASFSFFLSGPVSYDLLL